MTADPTAAAEARLGGRLPLVDRDSLAEPQQALLDAMEAQLGGWADKLGVQVRTSDGRIIGPFNPMLRTPEIAAQFLRLQAAEGSSTDLPERLRQVVIVTVGSAWNCGYVLYAHAPAARAAGLSASSVGALASGAPAMGLSPDESAVHQLTLALTTQRAVTDELYGEARKHLGEKALVDLAVLAGCYQLICNVLSLFAVPAP